MPLVSYSDSEDSDTGDKVTVQPTAELTSTSATAKPAFQKVVDRSNPQKITVHLPETPKSSSEALGDGQEPPLKTARLGAGTFGDFNSLLPAPKRAATARAITSQNAAGDNVSKPGAGLKTGAAPGFSRDTPAMEAVVASVREETPVQDGHPAKGPREQEHVYTEKTDFQTEQNPNTAKKGNSMMFRPLSVARKPKKKKTDRPEDAAIAKSVGIAQTRDTATAKKASLFSAGVEADVRVGRQGLEGDYRPMIYGSTQRPGQPAEDSHSSHQLHKTPYNLEEDGGTLDDAAASRSTLQGTSQPQSLDAIAVDLNLSASAKRQLFGRNRDKASEISVVNFDTDQEYAANELLRQAGEQAQHNAVRSIAPGKHSLKQLVNAASHQKDALEEHFSSGKRNKREAGSKYGW